MASSVKRRVMLAFLGHQSISKFLSSMDLSIKKTLHNLKCGLWEQTIPIMVVLKDFKNLDLFERNRYFKRHSNFRIISLSSTPGLILQATFGTWSKEWKIEVSHSWSRLIAIETFHFKQIS